MSTSLDAVVDQQLHDTTALLLAGCEPAEVPDRLLRSGWYELWEEEPQAAAHALFAQQGRLAKSSAMLSLLAGPVLAGVAEPCAALFPTPARVGPTRGDGSEVLALTYATALDRVDRAVMAVTRAGGLQVVALRRDELTVRPLRGLDPDLGLCWVDATCAIGGAEPLAIGDTAAQRCAHALALARRLLAEEMNGLVGAQLQMAVDHAQSRAQFGRKVGSYQAVKHRLAETFVAAESARLATAAAWSDPHPNASVMAKVHAGIAVDIANQHCLQVLGGIGFTWEHPFHRYYRRGRVLDLLLGSATQLTEWTGRQLLATAQLWPLAPL
ncbi:acyl-CoA dehydrogenase family protein [Mycobacterium vicinigordonae]|uniref:Acyl-CoA dehydrogenase/oxidase C-terminal domain-containing protein n=1 Tax=Mycobacterium vicinigordonae TaxID=1719132 RepID=A0A7D6I7B7_9MYCO|nr:acyl-CoA dehydrogenase family protein [Mycobacterium vicinigordonae]QLL06377.1 hypothetical protein H0P51_21905 [Mycobacterium vicinigordonae]